MLPKMKPTIGECEVCDTTNDEDWKMNGNTLRCASWCDTEIEATKKCAEVEKILVGSRKVDSSVTLKTDILVAKTVAAIELRAAIQNDPQYTTDEAREYAFTKE